MTGMLHCDWFVQATAPCVARITTSLSFSAIMANPRKFSEKIALHNQKQAEETAAFEAILREVSATTRVCLLEPHYGYETTYWGFRFSPVLTDVRLLSIGSACSAQHLRIYEAVSLCPYEVDVPLQTAIIQSPQHLQLTQPNLGAYRGGSLPNVNQMAGGNSVDLQVKAAASRCVVGGHISCLSCSHFSLHSAYTIQPGLGYIKRAVMNVNVVYLWHTHIMLLNI